MQIYGVRIYPKSTTVVHGAGAPIFLHGRVSSECSDFYYIFRSMAHLWHGLTVVREFGVTLNADGTVQDPLPELREDFGDHLVSADTNTQLLFARGDGFADWGRKQHFCHGALLPIFYGAPDPKLADKVFWRRDFQLTPETWPPTLRAILHMWDDIYWQLFSTQKSDVELLIRSHRGDPKLKMYYVDFAREYPDPSNRELQPI